MGVFRVLDSLVVLSAGLPSLPWCPTCEGLAAGVKNRERKNGSREGAEKGGCRRRGRVRGKRVAYTVVF